MVRASNQACCFPGFRRDEGPSICDPFERWEGLILNAKGERLMRTLGGSATTNPNEDYPAPFTMDDLRRELFTTIDACDWLDFVLLTKRIQNVRSMWPVWRLDNDLFNKTKEHLSAELRAQWLYRSNVWLLTSISDQATANAMIPHLLGCRDLVPVLGLSCEPLLGPVDLDNHFGFFQCNKCLGICHAWDGRSRCCDGEAERFIDWVIVGGESGPGARPYDLAWPRSIIAQCRDAGVAVFHKQVGSITVDSSTSETDGTPGIVLGIKDKKGGDMAEWEPGLQVREYPNTKARREAT